MADATLGVVASAFAVASLAIQLVQAAQDMHSFWHSTGNSSKEVKRIKEHLNLLCSLCLTVRNICETQPDITCGLLVMSSLVRCRGVMDNLTIHIQDLTQREDRGAVIRGWILLKTTIRRKTIQDIESELQKEMTLLIATLQPFF